MAYTTINKGSSYFDAVLWNGNGSSQTITGVGFQPDWVWIKVRSTASYGHYLIDSVRGVTKLISSDNGNAEITDSDLITSFNNNGFSLSTSVVVNGSGETYIGWNWLGANTTVSNTSGTITSTVSANTTAGFSIVSYTGTGVNATIGHGLGVVPRMIIVKNRTTTDQWRVYHANLGATQFLTLDTNVAAATSIGAWNDTTPTSSVFTVGNSANTNGNTNALIAYCFAEVKGYSKINSYTGNNSTDGPFVYTGFRPAFILIKSSSSTRSWVIFDNKLNPNNLSSQQLYPDTNAAETNGTASSNLIDILSNGFKMRGAGAFVNDSNVIYNYMAFAENPFVTSTGVPVTAR
jgi:hypothetical protein